MDDELEPVDTDDGNFISIDTRPVVMGPCLCPGRPHGEDTAEVHVELPWDVLLDIGLMRGGDAARHLVVSAIVSWSLVDAEGEPVPVTPAMVRRLRKERLDPIAEAVNEAYERARAPLPNGSGAPSRPSRRASASPNPTIRPHAKRTR